MQFGLIGVDPVADALRTDTKQAGDASKAVAFQIELERLLAGFGRIAVFPGKGTVEPLAGMAVITLATARRKARSRLTNRGAAVRTGDG